MYTENAFKERLYWMARVLLMVIALWKQSFVICVFINNGLNTLEERGDGRIYECIIFC